MKTKLGSVVLGMLVALSMATPSFAAKPGEGKDAKRPQTAEEARAAKVQREADENARKAGETAEGADVVAARRAGKDVKALKGFNTGKSVEVKATLETAKKGLSQDALNFFFYADGKTPKKALEDPKGDTKGQTSIIDEGRLFTALSNPATKAFVNGMATKLRTGMPGNGNLALFPARIAATMAVEVANRLSNKSGIDAGMGERMGQKMIEVSPDGKTKGGSIAAMQGYAKIMEFALEDVMTKKGVAEKSSMRDVLFDACLRYAKEVKGLTGDAAVKMANDLLNCIL